MRPEKDGLNAFGLEADPVTLLPAVGRLTPHEALSVISLGNISGCPDFLLRGIPQ